MTVSTTNLFYILAEIYYIFTLLYSQKRCFFFHMRKINKNFINIKLEFNLGTSYGNFGMWNDYSHCGIQSGNVSVVTRTPNTQTRFSIHTTCNLKSTRLLRSLTHASGWKFDPKQGISGGRKFLVYWPDINELIPFCALAGVSIPRSRRAALTQVMTVTVTCHCQRAAAARMAWRPVAASPDRDWRAPVKERKAFATSHRPTFAGFHTTH